MKKLNNLLSTINKLNEPMIIDGRQYESEFHFVLEGNELYDKNETYNIDYLETMNCAYQEFNDEFGPYFKYEDEDKIMKKLEDAVKKDLGKNAYIDWVNSVRMVICK